LVERVVLNQVCSASIIFLCFIFMMASEEKLFLHLYVVTKGGESTQRCPKAHGIHCVAVSKSPTTTSGIRLQCFVS
jgi:hypothetical protein